MSRLKKEAITSGKEDYANKVCKCCKCGIERVATFRFDYYAVDVGEETLLECENCFMTKHFGTANPPMVIIDEEGNVEKKNDHDPNLN